MAKLEDRIRAERDAALQRGEPPVSDTYQGVTKERIRQVLSRIDCDKADMADVVFALLDPRPSWFARPPDGARFCDGASTGQIGCHVGILQRGESKIDREGRDYWIKPLRDLAAIDAILLLDGEFVAGHLKAKSPNSAYRLSESFQAILKANDSEWESLLVEWIQEDQVRQRRELQAQLEEQARDNLDTTGHAGLIAVACEHYVPRFLPEYEVVYVDDGDGDRITDEERERLTSAGITLELGDAMPDVLLWKRDGDLLWVIEAVTSDGEVDLHKVGQLQRLAERCGKSGIDFTTAYDTWRDAAARQGSQKNIAPNTYLWIREDPSKHFFAESF